MYYVLTYFFFISHFNVFYLISIHIFIRRTNVLRARTPTANDLLPIARLSRDFRAGSHLTNIILLGVHIV